MVSFAHRGFIAFSPAAPRIITLHRAIVTETAVPAIVLCGLAQSVCGPCALENRDQLTRMLNEIANPNTCDLYRSLSANDDKMST